MEVGLGFASEKENVMSHYLNEFVDLWEALKRAIKLCNTESLNLECLEEGRLCEVVMVSGEEGGMLP